MAAAPLISVLMPVKDTPGRWLDAAVRSILAQTESRFEFLIVDDGSGAACRRRLEAWAARDPRIVLLRTSGVGVTRALNLGLNYARAEYVARMDGDDLAEPTRFAEQAAYLDAHPGCVAVGSDCVFIDPDGRPLRRFRPPTAHAEIMREMLEGADGVISHPAAALRRQAVARIGGYSTAFPHCEDLDLFLRLGEIGALANLRRPLLRYRLHLKAVSFRNAAEQWRTKRLVVNSARSRRGLELFAFPEEPPRPLSPGLFHLRWAAMAWRDGYWSGAGRHLLAALAKLPEESGEWRRFVNQRLDRRAA